MTIARNTAIMRDRRDREVLLADGGIVEPQPDERADPEVIVLSRIGDAELRRAIEA